MSERPPILEPLGTNAGHPPLQLRKPLALIGSHATAQLKLSSASVSPAHALLFRSGKLVRIVAIGADAVTVNGDPVRGKALSDGDHLQIAGFEFRFRAGDETDPPTGKTEYPEARLESPDGLRTHPFSALLLVSNKVHDDRAGLSGGDGHARVAFFAHEGRHYVRNIVSESAVRCNGIVVQEQELADGDTIHIGESTLIYRTHPGKTVSPTGDVASNGAATNGTATNGTATTGTTTNGTTSNGTTTQGAASNSTENFRGSSDDRPKPGVVTISASSLAYLQKSEPAELPASSLTQLVTKPLAPSRPRGRMPPVDVAPEGQSGFSGPQWHPRRQAKVNQQVARAISAPLRRNHKLHLGICIAGFLLTLAASTFAIWQFGPVSAEVDGRLIFVNTASLKTPRQLSEFQNNKEGFLRQRGVWQRAVEILFTSNGTADPGFLADPVSLTAAGVVSWRAEPGGDQQSLRLTYRGRDAVGDARRLDALLQSLVEVSRLSEARDAHDTSQLRFELLETEANDAKARLHYLQLRCQELVDEIKGSGSRENSQIASTRSDVDEQGAAYQLAVRGQIASQLLIDQLQEMITLPMSRERLMTVGTTDPTLMNLVDQWARSLTTPAVKPTAIDETAVPTTRPAMAVVASIEERAEKTLLAEQAIRSRLSELAGEEKKRLTARMKEVGEAFIRFRAVERKLNEQSFQREEIARRETELTSKSTAMLEAKKVSEDKDRALAEVQSSFGAPIRVMTPEKAMAGTISDMRGYYIAGAATIASLLFALAVSWTRRPPLEPPQSHITVQRLPSVDDTASVSRSAAFKTKTPRAVPAG